MEEQFSNSDLDSIIETLTDEDLRIRSQALDDAQGTWEEVAHFANPKVPCRECGGSGTVAGGSFSDICLGCMGARMLDVPGSVPLEMPPFADLRAAITAYGNALADHALPAGHRAKKQLALPPASTVPALEQIKDLGKQAINRMRELGRANALDPRQLPEGAKRDGLTSEGDLSDYTDAELDQVEDAEQVPPPKTKRRK